MALVLPTECPALFCKRVAAHSFGLWSEGRRGLTKKRIHSARCSSRRDASTSSSSSAATIAAPSRTQKIMESIAAATEVGGAGGAYSYAALKRLDQLWYQICNAQPDSKANTEVVSKYKGVSAEGNVIKDKTCTFDVLVCGGTLGVFLATALASKGIRVGIIERGMLRGRDQEWNISRKELLELVDAGILSQEDAEQSIAAEFNPNRCGFEEKGDIWVEGILNLGVSPAILLDVMRQRFCSFGGMIFEGKGLSTVSVYDDAVILQLDDGSVLSSELMIDAMGNFSPIVRQIRQGKKPDGVCLVVGSCASGFKNNSTSDVIFSSSSIKKIGKSALQYLWEAFPSGSGPDARTTYMFTYVDAQPSSPALEELLEEYWNLMPGYQGVNLEELDILRVIYGIFPTYRDSPLPAAFDRILQVGDASGIQSPVSFGGFGSMTRHVHRLSEGIHEAVTSNFLDSDSLSLLNPYMPNLSSSWLFQKAMSAKTHADVSPTFINELLYVNFTTMQRLGKPVLQPFLQDVIQFWPLVKTLGSVALTYPYIIPSIFKQVGVSEILDWSSHFLMLGQYTFLSSYVDPLIRPFVEKLPKKQKYEWSRRLEGWKYGSGLDYTL